MHLLFMGKPGAGKGSVTKRLEGDYVFLSTGDILREFSKNGTPEGNALAEVLKRGHFATDEQIFPIVENFLEKNAGKNIIFDGFPRNLEQAKECLKRGINFDLVVNIDVPDEEVEKRIVNRRVHPSSGRVYNIHTLPPKIEGKDDITGEDLVQRDDDKPDVVKERLKVYHNVTEPILDFLKLNGYDVKTIDGTIPIPEQVKLTASLIEEITPKKKMKIKP